MIKITRSQDLNRLRRLALSAQGLLQLNAFGSGLNGAQSMIAHLGYVQIDTISVVERAHNHVFHSRIPSFKPEMLNQMLVEKDIFEYWTHAAAFIPINDFRFSLPYKHSIKSGQTHWYKNKDKKLMKELLARIRTEGPLRSRDIKTKPKKASGWWDWKPSKKALEQLYMEGDLMVSRRDGFQKVYDLTERVLPSSINLKMPSVETFAEHLINQQLRCHGLVSLKGFTYLRRNIELRKAVKDLINEKLIHKKLEQVQLTNGDVLLIKKGALEQSITRINNRLTILSPFDNSVIQRDRLKSLFNYQYQIECYLPEAKRQFGYFCLPILYRGLFVGRMDCKAHRTTKQLEIKSLTIEETELDQDKFISAFLKAIQPFRDFQGCDSISLTRTYPKRFAKPLRNVLNKCSK